MFTSITQLSISTTIPVYIDARKERERENGEKHTHTYFLVNSYRYFMYFFIAFQTVLSSNKKADDRVTFKEKQRRRKEKACFFVAMPFSYEETEFSCKCAFHQFRVFIIIIIE